ncbi:hypothetical protein JDV09_11070 [Mycobacterium sp. Y57]|uniref:hypothetical protein n=1 Tax=Mycolicibacterium xanthum TaxID=2796469 RepID=UPI001C84CBB8|nr:hypothetical protein [Mycolicibacterium xanthum]MBX7432640.1 hypothetical protein [Mycolicibacterium xanthum]
MKAGRIAGRAGEFAVAVGVGVGLSLAAPTAWADDTTGGSSSESSTASSTSSDDSSPSGSSARISADRSEPDATKEDPTAPDDGDSPDADAAEESDASSDDLLKEVDDDDTTAAVSVSTAPESPAPPEEPSDDDPGGSADAPVMWVMAAAARRELGGSADTTVAETADSSEPVDITPSPLSADTLVATAEPAAPAPIVVGETTVKGTLTGYVFGSASLTPDGTRAIVTASSTSWFSGTTTRVAVVDTATGARRGDTVSISGTPTGEPLLTADGTRAVITTSKTSWLTGTTTRVSIVDTTTGARVGATVRLSGTPTSDPLISPDGTRAVITTKTNNWWTRETNTRVTVIDTRTAALVGDTVLAGGEPWDTSLNTGGTRAVVTTYPTIYDPATNAVRMTVIDTATGKQIGDTVSVAGTVTDTTPLSPDGSRALLVAEGAGITRVAVVDIATGTQAGNTIALAGASVWPQFSADGSRALIVTHGNDPQTNTAATHVTVIDSGTGTPVGAGVTVDGGPTTLLAADGAYRAVIVTETYDSAAQMDTAHIAVIDTASGAQIGAVTTVAGRPYSPLLQRLTADGAHAVITTGAFDLDTGVTTERTVVIETATGTQSGATVVLEGSSFPGTPLVSPDGTRVVRVATTDAAFGGNTWITVLDPATGAQIGTTTALTGTPVWPTLTADGSRAVVTTYLSDHTQVAVIDVATGTQTGATITIPGLPRGSSVLLNAGGDRVVIVTNDGPLTRIATIDTATGTQTGATVAVSGVSLWPLLNGTGTRALISAFDLASGTTSVALIDLATGAQIGTATFAGPPSGPAITADGSRAVITTRTYSQFSGYTTRVAVLQIA